MAMNRSTLFDRLDGRKEDFVDVIFKQTSSRYTVSEEYVIYAVTDANSTAAEVAMPRGPFIMLGKAKSRAAAGALAGKFKRWLKEYNDNV